MTQNVVLPIGISPVEQNGSSAILDNAHLMELTTEIAASYISNHKVNKEEIGDLMKTVFISISELAEGVGRRNRRLKPAVAVEDSITDDYITCLEDGKKLKMLKRHLKSAYNITPEQYRERWGLPVDYPMVAPNYAKKRSSLALKIGLGTSRRRNRDAVRKAA